MKEKSKKKFKIGRHQSFSIKKNWLRKGVKNILLNNMIFNSQGLNTCDIFGMSAGMISALKYWLTTTGVTEEVYIGGQKIQRLTLLGEMIDKYDRYYEDQGTNFLLHYKLASNKDGATAWYWFFNEYKPSMVDKRIFVDYFSNWLKVEYGETFSNQMLEDEYLCLVRTYYAKEKNEDSNPEMNECPLSGLGLLVLNDTKNREYKKNSPPKSDVNPWIAYAIISDTLDGRKELLISDIYNGINSLGKILNLDKSRLMLILESIEKLGLIDISSTAGLDVIKIKQQMSFLECAENYYL